MAGNKIDIASVLPSNAFFINDIPIQSGLPNTGDSMVYDDVTNQWQFLPAGSGSAGPTGATGATGPEGPVLEYIFVGNTASRTYDCEAAKRNILFDDVLVDNTSTRIKYNTDSTWTLQPGTYQLSAYLPTLSISIGTPGSAEKRFFIYWATNTADYATTGFLWDDQLNDTNARVVFSSCTVCTTLEVSTTTTVKLMFASNVSTNIKVTLGDLFYGYGSVLIKTLK